MANGISKEDLDDLEIVDAGELASDGTSSYAYRTGVPITSITSSTKRVISPSDLIGQFRDRKENPVEVGDLVVISGNAAAGTYTVATIVDDVTLEVVEAIVDAVGGTLDLLHRAGALSVGVDQSGLTNSNASNLQGVISDFDAVFLNPGRHEAVDSLVHEIAEDSYEEIVRTSGRVSDVVVWTDSGKTTKIRETNITRTGGLVSQVVEIQYDGAGLAVQTITKTYNRTDGRVTSVDVVET